MQCVPDTGNGKRFGKKKKNGSDRSLHLYMRRMADGGLPLKMQSEKENKPSFWRAKSPESLLRAGKVKQGAPFPSAKGTAFGTVTGRKMPEGFFYTNQGRRRDAACPSECRREGIHDGKKTDHGIFK